MPETAQRFHRPPRQWPTAVPSEPLRIAPPPVAPTPPQQSLFSTLFPVVGAVGIIGFALIYGRSAFLFIAGAMVALLILFSFGMRWSQKRQVKKQAANDSLKYSRYLKQQDRELAKAGELQHDALARLYPSVDKLWAMLLRKEGVWERRPSDPDFLHVRVGTGDVPLDRPVQLDLGYNPLAEYQEASLNEAKALASYRGRLPHEPVVVDLAEHGILAITGPRERTRAWSRSLLSQLAAFRAPQDLKVVAAIDPADAPEYEWAKWLPHLRLEHTVAAGPDEAPLPALALARSAAELDALLAPELGRRAEQLRRLAEASSVKTPELLAPELVVVVDGFTPRHAATELPAFRDLLARARQLKAVVVLLCDAIELEPGHVDARLALPARGKATFTVSGPDAPVIPDIDGDGADAGMAEVVARALAPLRLDDGGEGERSLAAEVRLLDVLGAADGELRVPVGVGDDGGTVVLDLKQAAEGGMGPHGILVGATGSGKSELLRSIVAGLAVRHSPERLSFVLVDFKGGAAFAPLARLPHVAGLITNLQRDLSLVDRMREALMGEQERRQALLRDAGDLDDVRAYRAKRASDPSLAPLPDLLVIVDEFAELLAARPEFLELFVQLGRVGRSLGIHLLLSSQRLDEGRLRGLESHLRYRICLRTFSAAESKLVLGTSDAYLLPSLPGLGYLKVDTEVYRQLRGALVSGAHRAEGDVAAPAPEVRTFDTSLTAQPTAAAPGEVLEDRTDLDVLLEGISGDPVHQVWVPPLPEALPLDAVLSDARPGTLRAVLGELDLPAEQRKVPLEVDLTGSHGHLAVVGAPRSGKSTVLRTLALSLASRYTPDDVRFYAIDLGGGLLGALEGLPHMGGVARRSEREAVVRVVRQLQAELEEREELLARLGLESIADARAARARGSLPAEAAGRLSDVFLLVDGWASVRSDFPELEADLHALAAAGLGLGLHVAVSANRWADMRSALLDNLGSRLELKLNDPLDSEIGRKAQEALVAGVAGRGLTIAAQTFQAALPRLDGVASDEGVSAALEAAASQIADRWDGPGAEPIRLLPPVVDPGVLPAPSPSGVAIGLEERALGPVTIDLTGSEPHLLAFGDAGSGKSSLLRLLGRGLAEAFEPGELRLHVLDLRRSLVDLAELPHVDTYAVAAPPAQQALAGLAGQLAARVPSADADALLAPPSWSGPRHVVLVDDYDLLAGPTGSPLAPLLDLLPVAPEVGLHVVLARRVAGSARTAFEPVLSRLRELGSPGLLLDGEPVEGPLLGGQKAQPQPPGRALLVRRGEKPVTVQIALATPADAPGARLGHPSRP